MIQGLHTLAEQHPVINWGIIVGTAIASWLAPIAALVTIGLGCLQGYIAWQKYKDWKRNGRRS